MKRGSSLGEDEMARCCAPSGRDNEQDTALALESSQDGPTDGMILIPGGGFLMGSADEVSYPADGEGPVREVRLQGFWIDATAVSN